MGDRTSEARTAELNRLANYLDEKRIIGTRPRNSLGEEYLSIPLPEVPGIFVHVEWLAAGEFRYKITMVNCRVGEVPELIGAVMTPEYVLRMLMNIRLAWFTANPTEYQDWLARSAGDVEAFEAGIAEGRS